VPRLHDRCDIEPLARVVYLKTTLTTGARAMKINPLFEASQEEIDALVSHYPLALVISAGAAGLSATPLPLLLERDAYGSATLTGHFARANPQLACIRDNSEALIVFQGPHGYISPSWFTDRTQAPTWNFATVHFTVRIRLLPSDDDAVIAVNALSAVMERARPNAWHPNELGARYSRLTPHVVAFRADILCTKAKFKLGQNERLDVLQESLVGLDQDGLPTLAAAMRTANANRLKPTIGSVSVNGSHETERATAST
jgi:transcriptional regulator